MKDIEDELQLTNLGAFVAGMILGALVALTALIFIFGW